jgi:hypothetical protein
MLNEVFADPKILKVLHGSTMDIIWLQRDLGLYVVIHNPILVPGADLHQRDKTMVGVHVVMLQIDCNFPNSVYQVSPPVEYLPFESTTATFVDTLDGVRQMPRISAS